VELWNLGGATSVRCALSYAHVHGSKAIAEEYPLKRSPTQELAPLAQHSLHKVLDLNNMRGLIMAELGDLDLQFDALLASLEEDGRAYVATRFVSTSTEQLEKRRTELQACAASPSTSGISALSDSSKRWDNLCRLQKKNKKLKDVTMPPFAADLLFPRNCLAHGSPRQEGSDLIFHFGGRDFIYNEQSSTQLRQTILGYREHLRKMERLLKDA
jgi:hypothetical protein